MSNGAIFQEKKIGEKLKELYFWSEVPAPGRNVTKQLVINVGFEGNHKG